MREKTREKETYGSRDRLGLRPTRSEPKHLDNKQSEPKHLDFTKALLALDQVVEELEELTNLLINGVSLERKERPISVNPASLAIFLQQGPDMVADIRNRIEKCLTELKENLL